MSAALWCVSVLFNPAGYRSLVDNYYRFAENLDKQGVKLLTVELAFAGDNYYLPDGPNIRRLRGNSTLWMKERLINHAVSCLPPEVKYFAWVDADVVFTDPTWAEQAVEKLKTAHIVQLFKKVIMLPRGHATFSGEKVTQLQSVVWQKKIHKNWLARRKAKDLPFSAPGFAWAARRDAFPDGIYDRNIIGSGDTFLVDCYFDSWAIHGYAEKFTPAMKVDMWEWRNKFNEQEVEVDYIPIDILHLWHGELKDRRYMERHRIIQEHNYDPRGDIRLENNVYEWASDKYEMHNQIKDYFYRRNEDGIAA